jgi:hypothetical protein
MGISPLRFFGVEMFAGRNNKKLSHGGHGGHGGHGVVDSGCDPHSLLPAKNLVHLQTLGGPRSVVAVVHRL